MILKWNLKAKFSSSFMMKFLTNILFYLRKSYFHIFLKLSNIVQNWWLQFKPQKYWCLIYLRERFLRLIPVQIKRDNSVVWFQGQLNPRQLWKYFLDLENPEYETHISLIHSRFSTNTFPSWERAHPKRSGSHIEIRSTKYPHQFSCNFLYKYTIGI